MRLIETIISKGRIIEQKEKQQGVLSHARYLICNINQLNRNNRLYEKEVWDRVLFNNEIRERMRKRNLWACDEHPEAEGRTLTPNIAGIVTNLIINESENIVEAELDILDTPKGRLIDTLLRAGCGIGVSTRADGELEEMSYNQLKEYVSKKGYDINLDESIPKEKRNGIFYRVKPESYNFLTVDFTAEPSTIGGDLPLEVEEKVVSQIKEAIEKDKLDKKFATSILKSFKCKDAKCLLESLEEKKLQTDIYNFYIVNDLYGGYTEKSKSGTVAQVDYVSPSDVIKLAKTFKKKISLAGPRWKEVGHTGYGEEVTPEEAEKLVTDLKKAMESRSDTVDISRLKDSVLFLESKQKDDLFSKPLSEIVESVIALANKIYITRSVFEAEQAVEKDKLNERISSLRGDLSENLSMYMSRVKGFTQKIKAMNEEMKRKIKEVSDKLNEKYSKKIFKLESAIEEQKKSHQQELKVLEAKHKKELFKVGVIERKMSESGLKFDKHTRALLERCTTEKEVDELISRFRYRLKESLLHYNGGLIVNARGKSDAEKTDMEKAADNLRTLLKGGI